MDYTADDGPSDEMRESDAYELLERPRYYAILVVISHAQQVYYLVVLYFLTGVCVQ